MAKQPGEGRLCEPNDLLRESRERLFGTQQAMAEAANEHLPVAYLLTANDIGKLERGVVRRPSAPRRSALRTVCGVENDAQIGLVRRRRGGAATASPPQWISATHDGIYAAESVGAVRLVTEVPPSRVPGAVAPAGWQIVGYLAIHQEATYSTWPALHALSAAQEVSVQQKGLLGPSAAPAVPDLHSYPGEEWDSFLTVTRLLASQRQAIAPAALLSLVEAHRDCLATLLRKAEHDPLRTHIGALLAEASIVASRLSSAQGNRPMALAHCAYARQIGDNLKNPGLSAIVRIFESNIRSEAATLIGRAGDLVEGLRMLEQAEAQSAVLGPAARARLAAEQAQILGILHLRQECNDALKRARAAAEGITKSDRSGLFSDWNASRLQVYEGTCHLLLGKHKKAVAVLEKSVNGFTRDRSNVNVGLAAQVDLASAYAETGELDRSCAMLGDTYDELVTMGNLRGVARAERARERLDRWNSEPVIRALDERMAHSRRR